MPNGQYWVFNHSYSDYQYTLILRIMKIKFYIAFSRFTCNNNNNNNSNNNNNNNNNNKAESVGHILAGCSARAQSKYLQRDNAVLKILFFEMLYSLDLIDSVPPWYSPTEPKPITRTTARKPFGMSRCTLIMWR